MHRVVVTGVGALTPVGLNAGESWRNLLAGVSGVGRITDFDPSDLEVQIAAEVKNFNPRDFMDFKAARRMDRYSQFAVASAGEAIRDAELKITPENSERIGVMMNTGGGGIKSLTREVLVHHTKGPSRVSPFFIPMFAPNMGAAQVSITYGITGPVLASVAACAAGAQAFVDALRMLRLGEVDVMVTGGAEAGLDPVAISAFGNMGALSKRNAEPLKASRPFDRDRDGFIFGEGTATLILETEEHARKRDARIYCELVGGAYTADAFHISAPLPGGTGAARAMKLALANANLTPRDIDYICAHGTSTPLNDISETAAIKDVFGEDAYRVAVSSPKSMIGHLVGAAGAVSGAVAVLAIRDNIVPPTTNLDNPDPECDLDYVPNVAREMQVDTVMVNAFGFGGQNVVAIFKRYEG
ncbi:3-oxoacyl-(acyl-carrier-protein) synthase II (Beta-ketoacyl-ACP synthase II) (KAS II) [Nitrolancea hollandica Lb]|uniref:3-oxoacyl-[acyl-carrier-protein] synthase 2 n=1 Tax=Nitrolancea hollandica Lb TaxID=1129897 RepID=I4EKM0_9BACT|nr:beta-ketoacyl-ACP synthase II [Nitrolancea hollandica]CCF85232.1 3-oxoacyl-(acyl-carrier-protein) synthase II (Beta-ketoacyl-ACP synthase II) (KAS II) [Nitrolancea hollandica Lb]